MRFNSEQQTLLVIPVTLDSGNSAQTSNVNPTVTVHTVNQTVDAGATVALTATATDQGGGSIASYLWTGSGTFTPATAEDTSWVAPSPTSETDYVLRLTATDDEGADAFDTVTITVRARLVAPSFTDDTGDAQSWIVGTAITAITVPAASGNLTPTYSASGLPAGISFNATTRLISGTPTVAGSGTITVTATNSEGTADWTVPYTTAAADAVAPTITIGAVTGVDEDQTLALAATVQGGSYNSLAYAWVVVSGGGTITGSGTSVTYNPPAGGVSADTSVTVRCTVTATADNGTTDYCGLTRRHSLSAMSCCSVTA